MAFSRIFSALFFIGLCYAQTVTVSLNDTRLVTVPAGLWTGDSHYSSNCGGYRWFSPGNSVSLTFTGTQLTANFLRGGVGDFYVQPSVDGVNAAVFDVPVVTAGCVIYSWSTPLLSRGLHTVVITNQVGSATGLDGNVFGFSYVDPGPTTPISTVTATTSSSSSGSASSSTSVSAATKKKSNTGVIVGAVVGAIGGLALLFMLIFCIRKNQRQAAANLNPNPNPNQNLNPNSSPPPNMAQQTSQTTISPFFVPPAPLHMGDPGAYRSDFDPSQPLYPNYTNLPEILPPNNPSLSRNITTSPQPSWVASSLARSEMGDSSSGRSLIGSPLPGQFQVPTSMPAPSIPLQNSPRLVPQREGSTGPFPGAAPPAMPALPAGLENADRRLSQAQLEFIHRLAAQNVPGPALATVIESLVNGQGPVIEPQQQGNALGRHGSVNSIGDPPPLYDTKQR